MKFIKRHLAFILPLMAILIGVEFYLVFERTTKSYEEGLRNRYSILIVAHDKIKLQYLQSLNPRIASIEVVEKKGIVDEISKGLKASSRRNLSKLLPYFYDTKLDSYLSKEEIEVVKNDLEKSNKIKRVETFDGSHNSTYKLFIFLKLIFKLFILFIGIVSFFLIIKQMEVWSLNHKERMRIMEIFGAPLFLRSAVMYRLAIIDTIIATSFVSMIFIYLKNNWAENSNIEILMKHHELIFQGGDIITMLGVSIPLVIISVFLVASSIKVEN
ncbi:Cell division protein FtsX [hydrothermal vent metagenome]|uniref:Cell division protein FtsX n=1 Tax=hydrothermal vent metagenome TaxID=652676 RepID=A0A1W1EJ62_9ZZZZ